MRKIPTVWVGLAAALVVVSAVLLIAEHFGYLDTRLSAKWPPQPLPLYFTETIYEEWKADEAAARSKYGGQTFYVYGTALEMEGHTLYMSRASCKIEKWMTAGPVQSGKTYLLKCRFDGFDSVYIVLKNCVLIREVDEDTAALWKDWKSGKLN
jgi:hypothetical protein